MTTDKEMFSRYDPVDYLQSEEDMQAYLDAAIEEADSSVLAQALANIARARHQQEENTKTE